MYINTNVTIVDIFYELFYDEFFKRYGSNGQLPMDWRKPNIQLAKDVNLIINIMIKA